ncbi:MAG: type II restriction endonuclease [Alphaproteobacteria bacterium]
MIMGYPKREKEYKADIRVQVKVIIKLQSLIDCQNIQVKLVSNEKGFNQIDKRWLAKYREMWDIPNNVYKILQYYVGELLPYKSNTKDKRRMFINEMRDDEKSILLKWVEENKYLIISDILKGRGQFSAEWILVIKKTNFLEWVLKPINIVMNYYLNGNVEISNSGNIHIGKITVQRKGGDGGRDTSKMLQFKLDPTELFKI